MPTPPSGPPVPVPPTTTTRAVVPPDLDALRAALDGALVTRGETDYDTVRRSYNPLLDKREPLAVASPSTADHVKACIESAAASALPIAARSGGHSYAGYSTPDRGLVVDLAAMADIEVRDDGTAVVGAGARLIDVYTALAERGRMIPAGTCPSVGIGGLTLGGGLGVLSRKYGLTCDNLVGATVVTADSRQLGVSAEEEPDLFWGLRGGGGGNFGIVTDFTFATHPIPDELSYFRLDFAPGAVAEALGAWQEWVAGAPPELWSNLVVVGGSPPRGRVSGCFVGPRSRLEGLLDGLAATPANRLVREGDFLDVVVHFAGCGSLAACAPSRAPREAFAASSRVLAAPTDPGRLVAQVDGRDGMDLLIDSLGGAIAEVGPAETAFPHREALATVQIYQEATAEAAASASRAVAEVRDALARDGLSGGYVNYIESAMPDWGIMYYGDNVNRLRDTAKRYDPDNVFAFAQGLAKA
ncbi:FAD-binding oxidoreductase [Actinokineospora guangxiensis]|uniref:FAD-binding oxidoreductase n=1 Tax=Actinokineospora guangxiensis TaxID=1490288 RepID=A0ABW0EJP8_9PSEU